LWVSIGNGFVLRRHAEEWTEYSQKDGLRFSYVRCLAQGATGEIWAAAQDSGLYVLRAGRFQTVLEPDAACRVVAPGRDGVIWAGTAASGLSRLTPRRVLTAVVRHQDWRGQVNGLVVGPGGEFWVGTYGAGLFHGSFGQLEPVRGVQLLDDRPHLTAGLRMSDGAIYFAGAGLLLRRAPATGELKGTILTHDLTALCEGTDHSLWLGTRKGELLHWVENAPLPVSTASFPGLISGLVRGPGSSLWLATQGAGLVLWDAGRVQRWTTAEGLPTDMLQSLHCDGEDTLCGRRTGLAARRPCALGELPAGSR
jgi:ligand-binding sensor domain-containing protein